MTTQRRIFLAGVLAVFAGLGLSACHHRRAGPAHGHRLKHERWGVDLVYNSGLGVYRVDGTPYYFHQERAYRRQPGGWEVGDSLQGPWFPIADDALPHGLRPPGAYDPYHDLDRDDRFERDDRDDRDRRGKKGKRSRDYDGHRDRGRRGRDRDKDGRRGRGRDRDRDRDHRGRDRDKDDERGRD